MDSGASLLVVPDPFGIELSDAPGKYFSLCTVFFSVVVVTVDLDFALCSNMSL